MTTIARIRQSGLVVPASLVLLGLVPAVAGVTRLAALATGEASAADARFFASPTPVILHVLAAVPFSLLGAFEFVPRVRRSRWHRISGRLLAPLGLVAALTGLWMAHFYPWPAGDGEVLYVMRLVVGAAMTWSIGVGLIAIRRRDFAAHGAWMTRAYALGMGAGTQVLTHLPWFALVGRPDEDTRAVLMGAAWLINALVAEYAIGTWRRFRLRYIATP